MTTGWFRRQSTHLFRLGTLALADRRKGASMFDINHKGIQRIPNKKRNRSRPLGTRSRDRQSTPAISYMVPGIAAQVQPMPSPSAALA